MSEPAWIVKWQAREALRNGRPDEAHLLLNQLIGQGNRRAFALRDDVVRGYLERAERMIRQDDVEAAWQDLLRVEEIAPREAGVIQLRETLIRLDLAEIRAQLEAGKPRAALQALTRLKERPIHSPEVSPLEEAAQEWLKAEEAADHGEFDIALSSMERVRSHLIGRSAGADRFELELARRRDRFRDAWHGIQDSLVSRNSREMLRLADEVLSVAPRHREAQQVRNRAWQSMQPETVVFAAATPANASEPTRRIQGPAVSASSGFSNSLAASRAGETGIPRRFFLWIDGVGAYLVCTNPRINLGQATPEGGPIDIPLYADISRIHATMQRDEESYVIEANKALYVNNKPATRTVLQCGDRLTLGSSCQIRFELPVPGCLSARMLLSEGRRLPMAVDGVLLLADMLVLGGGEKTHIRMPELEKPLVLFRQKDRLGIRWPGEFRIENETHRERAMLPACGIISNEYFTFAIEPIDERA